MTQLSVLVVSCLPNAEAHAATSHNKPNNLGSQLEPRAAQSSRNDEGAHLAPHQQMSCRTAAAPGLQGHAPCTDNPKMSSSSHGQA